MEPGWVNPTASTIPCNNAYALFIPSWAIEGDTLGSLARSTNPVIVHYAMVASVFFKFVRTITVPFELKCESVIDGDVPGFRYIAIVTGQQNANYDPDKLVRDEIVLFFENEGKNQRKKFARDEKDFAYMWRTIYGGLGHWAGIMKDVFPDIDVRYYFDHIVTECFSLASAGCDQSYEGWMAITFPDAKLVMDIPSFMLSTVGSIPFPDVYLKQLQLKRFDTKFLGAFAFAFQGGEAVVERPLCRRRIEPSAVTDKCQSHLPLHLLQQNIKQMFNVLGSLPADDASLKEYMREFFLDKFCDAFTLEMLTSEKRSAADMAYQGFSNQTVFFDGKDHAVSSNTFLKKCIDAEVSIGSRQLFFYKLFLAAMDSFHDMDRNHPEVLRLKLFAHDSTRLEFDSIHLNEVMYSAHGGVGKSHIVMMVYMLAIPNTAVQVNRFTPAAFTVDGTSANPNNPNQCGLINIGDDWDPAIFSNDPKQSAIQAVFKGLTSSGRVSLRALGFDPNTGKRIQEEFDTPAIGTWLVCCNTGGIPNHPLQRRVHSTSASEAPSATLSSTILESWMNQLSSIPEAELFIHQCRASQLWTYWVHQLQYCGMLPKFTMDGSVHFINAVFEELKRDPACPWFSKIDASFLSRLKAMAKVMTIDYITMDTFSRMEEKEITIRDVLLLKPRMWIPVEQMASAAFFLIEEWFSPLKFAVFDALKRLIRKQIEDCREHFKELFWADYIDNQKIPDYNWLRLSMKDAAQKVALEVCDMMGGNFVPNAQKIIEIFQSFTELAPKEVDEYFLAREYEKTLGRIKGPKKQKTLINIETGIRVDYLKVHTSLFDDLLVLEDLGEQTPFMGLGGSFEDKYRTYSTTADKVTLVDFTAKAEAQIQDVLRPSDVAKSINGWVPNGAKEVAEQMAKLLSHVKGTDTNVNMTQFKTSVFWLPAFETMGWPEIVDFMAKNPDVMKEHLIPLMEPKCRFIYEQIYTYDYQSRSFLKKPEASLEYVVHWFRNNDAKVLPPLDTEETRDYTIFAHTLVESAMKSVMAQKNQFERTIYAGVHPSAPSEMRTFVIGDISKDNAPAYDGNKGFSFNLKKKNRKGMGQYFNRHLPEFRETLDVCYDLDVYSQEVHTEKFGTTVLTNAVLDQISSCLSSSVQGDWADKYVHGVPLSELAPLSSDDASTAATKIREVINRIQPKEEDDVYFPKYLVDQQAALVTKVGNQYFNTEDPKSMCWIPFLCN